MFDKKGGLLVQRKSVISCIEGLQSLLDLVDYVDISFRQNVVSLVEN